jgi:hypothetical protein
VGVKGRWKLSAVAPDGVTVRRETPWIDNLIVDEGMDYLGGNGTTPFSPARVGTGNTAPNVSDSALVAEVSTATSVQSIGRSTNASSPYEMHSTIVLRHDQAVSNHNLAEVGMGNLFSRALTVDGGGSPTVFPWLTGEFLDQAYELIVYPPLVDFTDTVSISGADHDVVGRASGAGTDSWRMRTGGSFTSDDNAGAGAAYSGALGAITSLPSGTSDGGTSVTTVGSYTPGSFTRQIAISWGLNDGNVGGIAAATCAWGNQNPVSVSERTSVVFQASYDPVINKTSSNLLTLNYVLSWVRTP